MDSTGLRYASGGIRFAANLIDYGIWFVFVTVYITKFGTYNGDGQYSMHGWKALAPGLFWVLYFPIAEWKWSATLGHSILRMKVKRMDNGQLSLIDTLKRRFADIIEFGLFGIPAFICISKTTHHQRVGDIWANTLVIIDNNKQ